MTARRKHAPANTTIATPVAVVGPYELPYDPAALARTNAETAGHATDLEGVQVYDDFTAQITNEYLRDILRQKDATEEMRAQATRPLNDALKAIRAWFKPTLDLFDKIETECKRKLGTYELSKRQERQRALESASLAVQAGDHVALTRALNVVNVPSAELEGTSTRMVWRARIKAPDMIPYAYLSPNVEKINAHAAACPADREPEPIPGVVFERDTIVSVRR